MPRKQSASGVSSGSLGPTRVVFPEGSALGDNPSLWIWSVKEIVIE